MKHHPERSWTTGDYLTHSFNPELGIGRVTALEGRVGEPRPKYIRSNVKGLWQKPSVLNNAALSHMQAGDLDSAETSQYQIVGIYEVDIQNGRISVESPIARALIGKESGDEVQVQTPRGTRLFEVLKVQYA